MITAEIDTSRLRETLNGLYDAMLGAGKDVSNLLRDEARLLSTQISRFIPPLKSSWGAPKASGEMAIESELHNLVSEADESLLREVWQKHGLRDIDSYITEPNKGDAKLHIKWGVILPYGKDDIAEYHNKFRDTRGKVRKFRASGGGWQTRVIVPRGTLQPYIRKVQKRVGRWKASWGLTAMKLGKHLPDWISRHFPVADIAVSEIDGLQNQTSPSLVFGSKAPGNERERQHVQAAVYARSKAIASRMRLILSGYSKDVAAGIRPRKHHHDLPDQGGGDE